MGRDGKERVIGIKTIRSSSERKSIVIIISYQIKKQGSVVVPPHSGDP